MGSAEARKNIYPLTGVRALAALMVYLSHWAIPGVGGSLATFSKAGYAGVTFFFVLSGFIIGYTYLQSFESGLQRAKLGHYFLARIARVYPLYISTILVCYFFLIENQPSLWPFILGVQAWSGDLKVGFGVNAVSWSVSVEFFLYLCAPFLMFGFHGLGLLASQRRILGTATVLLVVLAGIVAFFVVTGRAAQGPELATSAHRWLYRNPGMRLFDFSVGLLAAASFLRTGPRYQTLWAAIGYASLAAIALMMANDALLYSAASLDAAYVVPFILLILSLAHAESSFLARVLGSRPFVVAGASSYAFYLIHFHVPTLAKKAGLALPWPMVDYVAKLAITFLVSYALHKVLEEPVRRLINSISRRSSPRVGHVPG